MAKHHRTFPSCILPRRRQIELLRQFPEGLFNHVVSIGSWLLTLDNTFDHGDRCVSMSIHFQSRTRIGTEDSVTAGFNRGLALATSLTEPLCSSFLVCIDPATYLSIPLTIRTQECSVLKQSFDQNFNTVSIFLAPNFYAQDWTDTRIHEDRSFRSSRLFVSKHREFSA